MKEVFSVTKSISEPWVTKKFKELDIFTYEPLGTCIPLNQFASALKMQEKTALLSYNDCVVDFKTILQEAGINKIAGVRAKHFVVVERLLPKIIPAKRKWSEADTVKALSQILVDPTNLMKKIFPDYRKEAEEEEEEGSSKFEKRLDEAFKRIKRLEKKRSRYIEIDDLIELKKTKEKTK